MYLAPENIDNHLRNEYFLPGVHWTIEFTSKRMCVIRENIEDYMRNELFW
jgi:hypothetical protein